MQEMIATFEFRIFCLAMVILKYEDCNIKL